MSACEILYMRGIVLRALLMMLLSRAAALSQRARCSALRIPFFSARAQARRQSWPPPHVLTTSTLAITTQRPPPFTKPTHTARTSPRPRRHAARLPPSLSPFCVRRRHPCSSPPLASLLPHSHLAPRPLTALRSPPLAASHARFFYLCPPLRRDVATELCTFSALLLVDIH